MLSQDGIMRFINIQTCKLLFEIGSLDDGISSSVISPHGRYIASIMENGSLNIYSVQTLTKEINKVCYQVNFPFFFKDLNVVSSKIKALLQFFNFLGEFRKQKTQSIRNHYPQLHWALVIALLLNPFPIVDRN